MVAPRKYPVELQERVVRLWRSEQPAGRSRTWPVSWACILRRCATGSARTRPTAARGMTG